MSISYQGRSFQLLERAARISIADRVVAGDLLPMLLIGHQPQQNGGMAFVDTHL